MIHISSSTFWDPACGNMFPGPFVPHGCNVEYAEKIKKEVNIPIAVVGSITDPQYMEEIIASGKADIIASGRGFIADPQWALKVYEGHEDDVTPCLRCNLCLNYPYDPDTYNTFGARVRHCTVNPRQSSEWQEYIFSPGQRKKVLIAGGGPGGMQAAITASDRGHQVILCEKGNCLGGLLNQIVGASFKQDYRNYRDLLIRRIDKRPIDVMLNTEVNGKLIKEIAPDIVISAIGGCAVHPDIDGIGDSRVVYVDDLDYSAIGKKVVIIGGGPSGSETALRLCEEGHEVTLIGRNKNFAYGEAYLQYMAVNKQIRKTKSLKAFSGYVCKKIIPTGVVVCDETQNEYVYPANTIIIATGMAPKIDEVEKLRSQSKYFRAIGNCRKIGSVFDAVHEGYDAAFGL